MENAERHVPQRNGIALPGAEATQRIFAERAWEVVIDFDSAKIIKPNKC